jgi:LysR family transcriptional regulator, glycine cleavage system transcriptional activator
MQLPSLESLQAFVAAAQTLNFRRAARMVALTPAAFGHRIRMLEELCGVRLFERTTRSVELTEAGSALLPHAKEALGALAQCVRSARGDLGPAPQEIVLGTRPDLGLSWLVPQIAALATALPTVTIHLYFGSTDDLIARLRTREIDCTVTSSRFADPRLDALVLHAEEMVFVGAPRLLKRTPFTQHAHAARHTLLDAGNDLPLFRYWRDAPGGGELSFARILRFNSLEAIHRLVLEGRGVAVLPSYAVTKSLARRRLRRLFPRVRPLQDHFRLVYRVDDARLPTYRELAKQLLQRPLS